MLKKLSILFLSLLFALPGICQEDDELLRKFEADRKRRMERAQTFDVNLELKKLGYETVTAASLTDERAVKIVQRMFKESQLKNMPYHQVRKLLFDKSRGTYMEKIFANNPTLVDKAVNILRDEEAMPGLVGIFLRKDDLKLYFFIWLGIIMTGFLTKRYLLSEEWKESFLNRFFFSLGQTILSLGIFYLMFRENLDPILSAVFRT